MPEMGVGSCMCFRSPLLSNMCTNVFVLCSVISSRCRFASPIITSSDNDIVQCDMNYSHSDRA